MNSINESETKIVQWFEFNNMSILQSNTPLHFELKIKSVMHMCSSCQGLLPALHSTVKSYNPEHTLDIIIESNKGIVNFSDVKTELLK